MGEANWGPTLGSGARAVTLYLEAALGVLDDQYQPNAVGVGQVGALQVQSEPTWTDLTDRLANSTMKLEARFSRATQDFSGWKLEAPLRNDDGDLSRHNSQSPYYLPGIGSTIRSGAPVRIRATYDNGSTVREWRPFTGYLKAWKPVYASDGYDAQIVLEADDDFARTARFDGFEQTPAGAGETTGARVNRVLNNAGHTGPRAIATGKHTVQATTLAQNALTELKLTADSEGGAIYSDGTGRIIFEDRDALATLDRSTVVQVAFADDGTPGALHYLAGAVEPGYDDELVVTDVSYARVGGTLQTVSSSAARAQQRGVILEKRTDLVDETDAQVLALARRTLALRKEARDRIDGLTLVPDAQFTNGRLDAALQAVAWDAISSGKLSHLALVSTTYTPVQPAVGSIDPFTAPQHIQGIVHRITPTEWAVDLSFSSADVWQAVVASRVGFGEVGQMVVWV